MKFIQPVVSKVKVNDDDFSLDQIKEDLNDIINTALEDIAKN